MVRRATSCSGHGALRHDSATGRTCIRERAVPIMSPPTALPIVDADTHVYQTDSTWSYLAGTASRYRPLTLAASDVPEDLRGRVPAGLRYWFMGGTLHFRPEGKHDQFAGEGTLELRGHARAARRHGSHGRRRAGDFPDHVPSA